MAKIDDVAKLANVSKGTVSNVFGRKRPVSKEVRERVLKAAKQLNYTPNHIARSLTTKQTMIIGLKIPYSKHLTLSSFQQNLISGVVTEASLYNYRVLIDTLAQDSVELPYLTTDPIDGVIILDPKREDERIALLHELNTPFVVIGKPQNSNVENVSFVNNNNEEIAFEVCDFLIQQGHEKILFLNAPESVTVSHDRKRGFLRAFHKNRLPCSERDNVFKKDMLEDPGTYGYEATLTYLVDQEYTAVIADTDKVALGILRALKELGKAVPDDVSVIAFSDDPVLSQGIDPPLTAVDLFASKLGSEAVKLLFSIMTKQDEVEQSVIVRAKLNVRKSSAVRK